MATNKERVMFMVSPPIAFLFGGLSLGETETARRFLPLSTLLHEIDTLEPLQHVTLRGNLAGTL